MLLFHLFSGQWQSAAFRAKLYGRTCLPELCFVLVVKLTKPGKNGYFSESCFGQKSSLNDLLGRVGGIKVRGEDQGLSKAARGGILWNLCPFWWLLRKRHSQSSPANSRNAYSCEFFLIEVFVIEFPFTVGNI